MTSARKAKAEMVHVGKAMTTRKGTAFPVKWSDPDGRFREE